MQKKKTDICTFWIKRILMEYILMHVLAYIGEIVGGGVNVIGYLKPIRRSYHKSPK